MNKKDLLSFLEKSQGFKSENLKKAFKEIDRMDFVLREHADKAYEDHPLPIGWDATISQPSTVLIMLNLLDPKPGEKILDVGAGSGWTTALLASAAREKSEVWGTELVPEYVEFGNRNLGKYNFPNAKIEQVIELGLSEHMPYDKVLVSAAAQRLPRLLIDQLKPGGRLVVPVQNSVWVIDKISEDGNIETKEYPGFAFVPLR